MKPKDNFLWILWIQVSLLPPDRGMVELSSRLFVLNTWLSTAFSPHSVHFTDNLNFFWYCGHLFFVQMDFFFSRSGIKVFTSNQFPPCIIHLFPHRKDQNRKKSQHNTAETLMDSTLSQHLRWNVIMKEVDTSPPPTASCGESQSHYSPSQAPHFTDQVQKLVTAGLQQCSTAIFSSLFPPQIPASTLTTLNFKTTPKIINSLYENKVWREKMYFLVN